MKTIKYLLFYLLMINSYSGIWALWFPTWFYTNFPGLNFHWIDIMGPYNEHLIRDVGAFFCCLASLSLFTLLNNEKSSIQLTCCANIVFSSPHLIYHIMMIDMFPTTLDRVAGIFSLSLGVLIPATILVILRSKLKSGGT